jgi:tRNA 2-thiouridine synthesizing protein E
MPTKRKAPKAVRRKTALKAKPKSAGKVRAKAAPPAKRQATARGRDLSAAQVRAPSDPRMIFDILHPGAATASGSSFRDAPDGWAPDYARTLAAAAGIKLIEDHWEVIRVLQGCYKDELQPRIRLLRDALEARFASKGGMKYLFAILPGGPIAQGCVFAGVKPPHGARDLSFGSVA